MDSRLYSILKDAYNKTINSDSYNIFSGLLENYWDMTIFNEVDVDDSVVEEFRLISSEDNYSLEFNDNKKSVTFIIKDIDLIKNNKTIQEYYSDENGVLPVLPILSLNTLMDSYYLDYLAKEMWKEGFTRGVLYTNEGLCLSLGNDNVSSNLYSLYDYADNEYGYKELGEYKTNSRIAFSSIKSFPVFDYEFNNTVRLYSENNDIKSYSVFYNPLTGYSSSMNIHNSILLQEGEDVSVVEVMFNNLSLIFSNETSLKENYRKQDNPFALILDGEDKIYTTEEFTLSFIPTDYYDYYEIILN